MWPQSTLQHDVEEKRRGLVYEETPLRASREEADVEAKQAKHQQSPHIKHAHDCDVLQWHTIDSEEVPFTPTQT